MKRYKFDKGAHMSSLGYKMSKITMSLPIWLLIVLTAIFTVLIGLLSNEASVSVKNFVAGDDTLENLLKVYIIANIGICGLAFFKKVFQKAFKLNMVNKTFMIEYEKVFKSETSVISRITPAKIESSINQIAVYTAEIWAYALELVKIVIPFSVTIWSIAERNLYAAICMVVMMAAAAVMSLMGDHIFHFSENSANMKGDMRSVSVNNFMVVRMLKYMSAFKYAMKRQKVCQDEASPSCHNMPRHIYVAMLSILYNIPVLIGLGVAASAHDAGLAVFVALNEWTITCIIDIIGCITETATEIFGLRKVIADLDGNDVPAEDKPAMPDKMVIRDVEFTYPNAKNLVFRIPEFVIERGKRYRFAGSSGSGKSSLFRYFAGEMDANRPFDVRTFYIHQRTELLHDTVRNNITLGNKYVPDHIILELIRDVKLDKWFDTLPDGLDTIIGADIEPSGGEASRISLLRLFVHLRNYGSDGSNPITNEVIILDEVTSALDKRDVFIGENDLSTEESVIKVIDRETKGSTMFVISHEDVSSNAFGFKDIVDEQMIIDIVGNDRILKKMSDNRKIDVTHQWGQLHKIM